jgi:hypothetical protein
MKAATAHKENWLPRYERFILLFRSIHTGRGTEKLTLQLSDHQPEEVEYSWISMIFLRFYYQKQTVGLFVEYVWYTSQFLQLAGRHDLRALYGFSEVGVLGLWFKAYWLLFNHYFYDSFRVCVS